MLKTYLKTTLRILFKKKTFGFLNIIGLATGIACASLIFLWVEDELHANHNFSKRDRIYQIYENQSYEGKLSTFHATPGLMGPALTRDIPGIKRAARSGGTGNQVFSLGNKSISEPGDYADSSFISMLDLPFTYGKAEAAFQELHSLVISESMSKKFFGNGDPTGKNLRINNEQDYTITGVFKDLPKNSSLQFSWLAPIQNIDHKMPWMQVWNANWARTYIELEPTADPEMINKKLSGYLNTKDAKNHTACFLFSMNDWNLHDSFTNGKQDGGRIIYVQLFSLIACIVLLIACINFMNLSTARSEQRAKEVGVRKVMGAGKNKLISQFITEALVMAALAVVLSIVLVWLVLPGFNILVEKQLSIRITEPSHIFYLFGISLMTGLVAGSYPAFYLSSFNPVYVLKGLKMKSGGGQSFIRQSLVVMQFSVSIILIIGTITIYKQINQVRSRELGYEKNNLVYLEMQGKIDEHIGAITQDLLATGAVSHAAVSEYPVLQIWNNTDNYSWAGKDPSKNPLITWEFVNTGFLTTMGMQLAAGRDFYSESSLDSNNVIINESFAKQMGKEGRVGGIIVDGGTKNYQIVGIVKDFLYNNMYVSAAPLLLYNHPLGTHFLSVRLKAGQPLPAALDQMEKVLKADNPGYPVEFKFVDEDFNQLFKTETLTGKLAVIFAGLAIVISCLGLFGLAAYTAERRIREIGIRKVLGASTTGLVGLLSRDFVKLVIISCLIAFPAAWWGLNHWLEQYAYRTTINWWVFAIAGMLAIFIALFTVSFQAIKAAVSNPVNNLRTQ
jgi:putative ABC transport system permease protein